MIEEQGRTGEQEERDAVAPGMDDMLSLDDDEWRAVLAALPALVSARARNGERTRAFVDAVLWIAATGRPWVQLSSSAGPWHSVYVRFTRWAHEGLWDKVIVALDARSQKAGLLRRLVATYLRSRSTEGRR
jgi:transposase